MFEQFEQPWYDRNSAHTTPYTMYATGIGYRADKITGMTGSWRDLVDVDSSGKAFMLDDFQEGIGMANLVNGQELNTVDPEELERSKDLLIDWKPDLRGYSSDTITNMVGRQRLDPAPLERRRGEHPQPGRQPGELQVPEVRARASRSAATRSRSP